MRLSCVTPRSKRAIQSTHDSNAVSSRSQLASAPSEGNFLYQGDELGMTNYPFRSVEDYDDVAVGIAMTPAVIEDGAVKSVMVFNATYLMALTQPENEEIQPLYKRDALPGRT